MHITCCVLGTTLFYSLFLLTNAMTRTGTSADDNVGTAEKYYSETAILEIQFRNKCKKSCTATVISDTVVLTAARCLVYGDSKRTRSTINLDLSFVVIGTKKMHATGREQYLPIERIQFHPELRSQHVDLALVYTDTSMKSNRGGATAKLVRSKVTQNERQLTVISWEPMSESERREKGILTGSNIFVPDDDDDTKTVARKSSSSESRQNQFRAGSSDEQESSSSTTNEGEQKERPHEVSKSVPSTAAHSFEIAFQKWPGFRRSLYDLGIVNKQSPNTLASGTFMLLTPMMCRTFLQRARPKVYKMEELANMACFTSDTRYVTDDDLGAGVFYNGKLLGVTVDHVELNMQYVGVAMQVSCFCDWLMRKGGAEIRCVPKCCMKADDDLESPHNYTSYVKTTKSAATTRTTKRDFTTEHPITTTEYSPHSASIKTTPIEHEENEYHHIDITTTRPRQITIDSFSGFPDFSKSSHRPTESDEDGPHFTNEYQPPSANTDHYQVTDKQHHESPNEYEKGHSDLHRLPNYETTRKSAYEQYDAQTKDQYPNTREPYHNIMNMESSGKNPKFKSQDEMMYPVSPGAPPRMMKLINYPTETSERMMDSRLAGLEYYLVN